MYRVLLNECAGRVRKLPVDNVWPLYGPVAGGTRVTITGQSLNKTTVTAVYFGQYKLYPDINRLQFTSITMIRVTYFMIYDL